MTFAKAPVTTDFLPTSKWIEKWKHELKSEILFLFCLVVCNIITMCYVSFWGLCLCVWNPCIIFWRYNILWFCVLYYCEDYVRLCAIYYTCALCCMFYCVFVRIMWGCVQYITLTCRSSCRPNTALHLPRALFLFLVLSSLFFSIIINTTTTQIIKTPFHPFHLPVRVIFFFLVLSSLFLASSSTP